MPNAHNTQRVTEMHPHCPIYSQAFTAEKSSCYCLEIASYFSLMVIFSFLNCSFNNQTNYQRLLIRYETLIDCCQFEVVGASNLATCQLLN